LPTLGKGERLLGAASMETDQICLHKLFQQQAERTPEAISVVDGDRSITYSELDHLTDCLAGYLQKHGVSFDNPVGIFMETCAEYVIAYIAILKAGGAYMPLDLAYPNELLYKILAETRPKVIVTKADYADRLSAYTPAVVLNIDTDHVWQGFQYDEDVISSLTLDNLAFVAYTSGTTGDPKGVLQTHRAAVHSYTNRYEVSSYVPGDRVACNVFFVWELLRPLLKGAACYIIPDDVIYDPRQLMPFITEHGITEILFTPSLLETIINSADPDQIRSRFSSLKVIWLNGEVVTTRLKNRILDVLGSQVRLLNTYSISECHDVSDVDLREVGRPLTDICSVGRPRPGVTVKLLGEDMQPVPSGSVGELYIGGPCLARGYLDKPGLTAERFVWIEDSRFYRTGDLAEIRSDGTLEIKGRCDDMVKVRGYSIHLGAVETALLEHANVKSCAVVADGQEGEDKRLVAYVVRNEEADWQIDRRTGIGLDIRKILVAHLAHYMIPSMYVELDEMPINEVTGKLDRKSLPLPPTKFVHDFMDLDLNPAASIGEQKDVMRALWEGILLLKTGSITNDSDFFDFGGHSLSAVALTIEIESLFGVQLLVKDIYQYRTISGLVDYIAHGEGHALMSKDSIRDDAFLDPSIVPATIHKPLSVDDADSIFVTGTTGFLGAFLLDELLRTTHQDAKIYCLVRVKNGTPEEALDRVINNLKYYQLYDYELENRIVPVIGDLKEIYFGLPYGQYSELAEKIDYIFHCASLVNYVYSYSDIKPSTVDGTREILRFACTSVTKPLSYISTNGVFPRGNEIPYLETSDIDAFADQLEEGYSQAKWVAERLAWQAISRGLPVSIYRPGNIGHHSVTGIANPKDFQAMIIDACAKVNCAPRKVDWKFEMTPVDVLVKAIRLFASQPSYLGTVFNVFQNNPMPAREVFDLMLDNQVISEVVPVDDWKSRLCLKAASDGDYILNVLDQSLEDIQPHLHNNGKFDCAAFESALAKYNINWPSLDIDYFHKALFANTVSLGSRHR